MRAVRPGRPAQVDNPTAAPSRAHSYAQLYRQVLAALGARIRFRLAADVILATFFVNHLTPFGSATGALVNASALESDGIAYIRLRLRPDADGQKSPRPRSPERRHEGRIHEFLSLSRPTGGPKAGRGPWALIRQRP